MKTSLTLDPRLAKFPAVLRKLLEAELAAGNTIVEVASCFPAPPAGAYAKLGRQITTRPRAKTAQLDFYDRNSSLYSGEWTDEKRFYFVIEPPLPPPPEPDMDAIRNARNAAAARSELPYTDDIETMKPDARPPDEPAVRKPVAKPTPKTILEQFKASMVMDYYKWHDGEGYDIALLKKASAAERGAIEEILLRRTDTDWRDIEALAALNTPKARTALKAALKKGDAEIRGAVLHHAPELVSDKEKTAHLVDALRKSDIYGGLTQALDDVAEFHPEEIVEELFLGVLNRKGEIAVHYAAMLMFIHGKAKKPFDPAQRPFFLRFNTKTSVEREKMFRELCEKIDVDPKKYLGR